MTDYRLTAAIDELVQEKTFSLESVGAISALREKAKEMETKIENMQKTIDTTSEDMKKDGLTIEDLQNSLSKFRDRERLLIEREGKANALDRKYAVAVGQSEVYKECFGVVFRNTSIRKEMFGMTPVRDASGYPTGQSTSETVTETPE